MSSHNHEQSHHNSSLPVESLHHVSITISSTTHRSDGPSTTLRRRHWSSRRFSRKHLCLQSEILSLRAPKNIQEQLLICIVSEHTRAPCLRWNRPFYNQQGTLCLSVPIYCSSQVSMWPSGDAIAFGSAKVFKDCGPVPPP
jgi:hypothetical protein